MAEESNDGKGSGGKPPSGGKGKNPFIDTTSVVQAAEGLTALRKMSIKLKKDIEDLGEQSAISFQIASTAVEVFTTNVELLGDTLSKETKKIKEFAAAFDKVQKSLNKSTSELKIFNDKMKDVGEQSKAIDRTAASTDKLASSLKQAAENTKGFTNVISDQTKQSDKLTKSLGFKKGGDKLDGSQNFIEQIAKSSKSAAPGVTILSGAFKVLGSIADLVWWSVKKVLSIIGSVFKAGYQIFAGFVSFVKTVYESIFDMAAKNLEYLKAQAEKIEEIRQTYGDIRKGTGASVVAGGQSLFSGMIGGLSGSQVFADAVAAMDYFKQFAADAGPLYEKLIDQFAGTGTNDIIGFAKGLNLTNEEMKGLMSSSIATGRSVTGVSAEITKYSKQMEKSFGTSFKLVAKDMAFATNNMKYFGSASFKEMAQASVYARKLGVDLQTITKVMDKFNTFEDAADNISKLSQAFGVNINAMDMLKAKSPDQQIDMLRKALFAAGKSAETMNRHELQMLATTVNATEEQAKQIFSMKNQGAALSDISKAGEKATRQTMSSEQALLSMTQDIGRYIRDMQTSAHGFFDVFLEGFMEGIPRVKEMRNLLNTMGGSIFLVKQQGKAFASVFFESFPGIKNMVEGLTKVMNPKIIGGFFQTFSDSLKKFFKNVKEGNINSISEFIHDMLDAVKKFFAGSGAGGSQILSGFTELWEAAKTVVASFINFMGDFIAKGFEFLADLVGGKFTDRIGKVTRDAKGNIIASFTDTKIGAAFMSAYEKIKPEWNRFTDGLQKILEKNWNKFTDYVKKQFLTFLESDDFKQIKDKLFGALFWGSAIKTAASAVPAIFGFLRNAQMTSQIAALTTQMSGLAAATNGVGAAAPVATGGLSAFIATISLPSFVTGLAAPLAALGALGTAIAGVATAGGIGLFAWSAYELNNDLDIINGQQEAASKQIDDFVALGDANAIKLMAGLDKQGKFNREIKAKGNIVYGEASFGNYLDKFVTQFEGSRNEIGDTGMTETDLVDRFAHLLPGGSRSWWSTDSTDAQTIMNILEQKHQAALNVQKSAAEAENKLIEEKKRQDRKRKEEAENKKSEDEYNDFMKLIGVGDAGSGKVNIQTFQQKIAAIDAQAKKITGGTASLKTSFDNIRKSLRDINFNIFDDVAKGKEKAKQIKNGLKTLLNIRGSIIAMEEIALRTKLAAQALEEAGDPTDANSSSARMIRAAQNQKKTVDTIIQSFAELTLDDFVGPQTPGKDNSKKQLELTKNVRGTITETQNLIGDLLKIPETVKQMGSDKLKITDAERLAAIGNIEGLAIPLTTVFTAIGSQFGQDAFKADMAQTLIPIKNRMVGARDTMDEIVGTINDMGSKLGQMSGQAAIDGIRGMFNVLRDMDNDLKAIAQSSSPVNIAMRLGQIAGTLGLKDTKYRIEKGSTIMYFNFTIEMDANELEKTMVTKTNSIVRVTLDDMANKGVTPRGSVSSTLGSNGGLQYTKG